MATRTIGTEIVLSGEKQFNDAMKSVNNNLRNLKSDMALTTAEFADNADSVNALSAKQKLLQSSVEQHRAKVDALRDMYEQQKKQYGENSAAADKYKQQLNQATAALLKEESALKKTTDALEDAESESNKYVPITQRLASSVKDAKDKVKDFTDETIESAHHTRGLAEVLDAAKISAKGLSSAMNAAGTGVKAVGKGVAGVGKVVGGVSAAAAAGVAAMAAASGVALVGIVNMAKEAAEAAKTAYEAGETLTDNQQQWLDFSIQLDTLDGSVANAKSAIAGILLPMLGDLSTEGTTFLNDFTRDMTAAAGNTEKQTQVLGQYIANGAKLIINKLPEYIKAGKNILIGVIEGFGENSDDLLDMGLDLIMDLLQFIMDNAPALADAGLELVLQLIEGIDAQNLADSASKMVDKIVTGLAEAAPELIPAAVKLVMELILGLAKNAPMLLESGWDLILAVLEGILAAMGEIGAIGPEIINELVAGLRSSDSKILQFGADVIEWIADGIFSAWNGLVSWFNNLFDSLFSKRTVDINVNGSAGGDIDGSHASGLRYVPFDGYIAKLHRGEAVLTASEAAAYRTQKSESAQKTFNMVINTQSISQEEIDSIVEYVNRKLGDDF